MTDPSEIPIVRFSNSHQYYTEEEDEFIFDYVMKFGGEYGEKRSLVGNQIWKEMERKRITIHPWQSMKDRYLRHIQHFPPKLQTDPLTIKMYNGHPIRCLNPSTLVTSDESKDLSKERNSKQRHKKRRILSTKSPSSSVICSMCYTPFNISSNSFHICTVIEQPVSVNEKLDGDENFPDTSSQYSCNETNDDHLSKVLDSIAISNMSDKESFSSIDEESFFSCSEGEVELEEQFSI